MRIHSQTLVTVVVTLLFVSGTVGCHSNGGAWYNPKSYTWTNPFTKSSDAPAYSADAPANSKPSLDAQPNLDVPNGGYTDGANSYAIRNGMQSSTSGNPSSELGTTSSLSATQGTTSSYGSGYSVAETSPYPPPYASGQSSVSSTGTPATNPYQYASATATAQAAAPSQYPTTAPLGTSPYGNSDYSASAGSQQYQPTNAVNYPPATPNYTSGDQFGGTTPVANPSAAGSNYAPFGATAQNAPVDPYAAPAQQPVPTTSAATGSYYDPAANQQPMNPQPATAAPVGGGYYDQQPSAPLQPYPSAQPSPPATGYGY